MLYYITLRCNPLFRFPRLGIQEHQCWFAAQLYALAEESDSLYKQLYGTPLRLPEEVQIQAVQSSLTHETMNFVKNPAAAQGVAVERKCKDTGAAKRKRDQRIRFTHTHAFSILCFSIAIMMLHIRFLANAASIIIVDPELMLMWMIWNCIVWHINAALVGRVWHEWSLTDNYPVWMQHILWYVLLYRLQQQPDYNAAEVQKDVNFRKQLGALRKHIIAGNVQKVEAAIGKVKCIDDQGKFADRQQEALNKPDQNGYTLFMLACKSNQPCVGVLPFALSYNHCHL